MNRIRRHGKGLLVGVIALVVVLGVGIPFAYIHFVDGDEPAPLSLADVGSSSATAGSPSGAGGSTGPASGGVDGTWRVTSGSQAGYRVHETLAGQSTTAVGRTSDVSGSLTVSGTDVSAATFTVPVAKITSDRSQRDSQFRGRIMDADRYPDATFTLTEPIHLGTVPAVGTTVTAKATGNLKMHGTTRPETFTVSAKRTANSIAVTGDIDVTFADFHIDNPSFGGFVSVGDTGTVEFLLVTNKT